ncbi:hypothetical protein HYR65_03015 [Candidatus Azambacteria bacterium]|nr:hypothetical protein [Candidatus Azambacteria bacterium]
MRKILYIHPDESIAYLIDRMENTEENTIYIAADRNPALFIDAVNIKLLRREAVALGKNIVIASLDRNVLDAAKNASMDSLEISVEELEAEEEHAAAPVSVIEDAPAEDEPEEINVRVMRRDAHAPTVFRKTIAPEASRVTLTERNMLRGEEIEPHSGIAFSWKFITLSFIATGVAAGAGFYALSPRLSVVIVPKKETVRFDFQAVADSKLSAIDVGKARIPGQSIQTEKTAEGEFTASSKNNQETKAEGELTVYNEFSSNSQTLVKSTRFTAKDGNVFRLKNGVVVPGATIKDGKVVSPGMVTAAIIADQAGAAHNIGPSDFTIPGFAGTPKFTGFRAKSSKPMTGGGTGGSFAATADDLEKAKAALSEKLAAQTQEYINANIGKGLVVLAGARTQGTPDFSADTPDAGGKFKARLKAAYEVFAFSESDVAALAEDHLVRRLLDTQKTVPGTRVVSYADETMNSGKTALSFTVKVNELAAGAVKQEQIQAQLAGKGEDEIKRILRENEAVESAEVTFWPFWISLAPDNPKRITVTVQGM